MIEGVQVGFDGDGVFEAALEETLEGVDFVDVAEEGVDLRC